MLSQIRPNIHIEMNVMYSHLMLLTVSRDFVCPDLDSENEGAVSGHVSQVTQRACLAIPVQSTRCQHGIYLQQYGNDIILRMCQKILG